MLRSQGKGKFRLEHGQVWLVDLNLSNFQYFPGRMRDSLGK